MYDNVVLTNALLTIYKPVPRNVWIPNLKIIHKNLSRRTSIFRKSAKAKPRTFQNLFRNWTLKREVMASKYLLVASIDFGTTFSGWAFSFKHEFERDPLKVFAKQWTGEHVSLKAPTCALIRPDGRSMEAFGYEAENRYAELAIENCHHSWFYFKRFKMLLFDKMELHRDTVIEDALGKKLTAKTVFSLCIRFLREDAMKTMNQRFTGAELKDEEVLWVLTVPAIWNDPSKQFMREAAEEAGINGSDLLIALEPESASLYCRHLPAEMCRGTSVSVSTFKPGTKYMVLDAGGGTVDITVHEVLANGGLRELHKASGGAWGGTKVDEAYEKFLDEVTGGKGVLKQFKEKHMENYVDLIRDFEIKKRDISTTGKSNFRLPSTLTELIKEITGKTIKETILQSVYKESVSFIGDKLRVEAKIAMKFFDIPIDSIIAHVSSLIQKPTVSGCSVIVMVGGFSESTLLQDRIRSKFSTMDVITPNEAGTVVLKGAVIFGHNPGAIAQRVLKITYGQEITHAFKEECLREHPEADRERDDNGEMRCFNIIDIHARAGQAVTDGQEQPEQVYTPLYDDQAELECSILTSEIDNPKYVTDCHEIGKWCFPIPDTSLGRSREFGVTFMFGGTEVVVKVVDKVSKVEKKIHLDCL
ncbi:heat shock 70 kDa protein 12A-like [Mya arenaria]|uniref:heat shock 70 kDa protein 12A-like n=1 Tax=Mya arenaria TaxID=6604 RepID=UPI0022E68F68|nr:heat shock 70 kDa protein 12A-like [Mya arenaria]